MLFTYKIWWPAELSYAELSYEKKKELSHVQFPIHMVGREDDFYVYLLPRQRKVKHKKHTQTNQQNQNEKKKKIKQRERRKWKWKNKNEIRTMKEQINIFMFKMTWFATHFIFYFHSFILLPFSLKPY